MTMMTAQELVELMETGAPVTVLDIRRSADRADWAIPGSVHVDVYDELRGGSTATLDETVLPVGEPVVLVCNSGVTSARALDTLQARGVDARNLTGGMRGWSNAWNALAIEVPNFDATVLQVRRLGKGCLSYIVASNGAAAVFDPSLDAAVYLQLCAEHGWNIAHVFDTHVHADHVSRARDLAERTNATLHIPSGGRLQFDTHEPADGEEFAIGGITIRTIESPGHTPESVAYLVDDAVLIGGDTVFPQAVGRPDLATDADGALDRARLLHASLHKLLGLDDEIVLLPCHADVLIAHEPVRARLGDVRDAIMVPESVEEFGESILQRIPPTPMNHLRIVRINERGMLPQPGELDDLEAGANRCAIPTS